MYNDHTHPLLAQVPLTVSPFVSLPTATTLPYTYKSLPSTLPPSSTGPTEAQQQGQNSSKAKFIVSSSGNAAHPDDLIASCQALQQHLQKQQDDARKTLEVWENDMRERDLAERRRVAPGWLDSDAKLLQPQKAQEAPSTSASQIPQESLLDTPDHEAVAADRAKAEAEGEELDRAFGGMAMRGNG